MIGAPKLSAADTGWFVHDRFGLFIHWGIYALPAPVRSEWFQSRERVSEREYRKYFDHFDPQELLCYFLAEGVYRTLGSPLARAEGEELRMAAARASGGKVDRRS